MQLVSYVAAHSDAVVRHAGLEQCFRLLLYRTLHLYHGMHVVDREWFQIEYLAADDDHLPAICTALSCRCIHPLPLTVGSTREGFAPTLTGSLRRRR